MVATVPAPPPPGRPGREELGGLWVCAVLGGHLIGVRGLLVSLMWATRGRPQPPALAQGRPCSLPLACLCSSSGPRCGGLWWAEQVCPEPRSPNKDTEAPGSPGHLVLSLAFPPLRAVSLPLEGGIPPLPGGVTPLDSRPEYAPLPSASGFRRSSHSGRGAPCGRCTLGRDSSLQLFIFLVIILKLG